MTDHSLRLNTNTGWSNGPLNPHSDGQADTTLFITSLLFAVYNKRNGDANFSPILLPSVQMAKCRYRFYCQGSLRVRCTILSTDLHRGAELLKSLWPMSYKKRLCRCHRNRVPSVMENQGKPGKCKKHFPDLEKIMEFDKKTKIMELSQG